MAIQKLDITEFLEKAKTLPVFDVRSPGENSHAHIPGSYALPLFSDEERKVIGTAYKKESRQKAIKYGLDFFGVKMKLIVETVESIIKEDPNSAGQTELLVHCWRGGMRSGAVAWLLDLYGYKVYTLAGGYKAYRNWVLAEFEQPRNINILAGYTGSGKTEILATLKTLGHKTIDLEAIAGHKGSAFGGLGMEPQPTPEMFENLLARELNNIPVDKTCWLEDESQRIGLLNIPSVFWNQMRKKRVLFIDIPFEERLAHIIRSYGVHNIKELSECVQRIQKRLGPLETKTVLNFLAENNTAEAFRILLRYYDRTYEKSLSNREIKDGWLNKIESKHVDMVSNTTKILTCAFTTA